MPEITPFTATPDVPEPVESQVETSAEKAAPVADDKKIAKIFKSKSDESKTNCRKYHSEWRRNVELRIGHLATPFTTGIAIEDDVQTEINPDWALTKIKTANLFSQVPAVQGTHENTKYAAAVAPFMKALTYEIGEKRANVGVPMEEALNDVVNASGIAGVVVGYAARFENVDMPAEESIPGPQGPIPTKSLPPEVLQQFVQMGVIHMVPTPRVVSDKFFTTRLSPGDLLWPVEFVGSNFDDGDWIGFTGKTSWSEAKNDFKLTDDQKAVATSNSEARTNSLQVETEKARDESLRVKFDEIYYWRYKVDPEEKNFKSIWKIVFVHGIDEPVVHEQWKGQKYDETSRKYVGACKFPIRILTLTYITDNPIPPSDSSAGRPQVNDMRRSRNQMFDNRERSIPIRGFNTNRVDPLIAERLMNGTWQGMIPFNGDAQNSIWEVARASYPSEDMAFDQQTQRDLDRTWQVEPNNSPGRKTKDEVNFGQQNFSTRIGQERARVASFFLSIVEILAGLMALYSDFPTLTDEEKQTMQGAWDSKSILHDLVLKIRPDSTIVLDSNARIEKLMKFLNMTVKSGFINAEPIIAEIAELSGIDPASVMIKPEPPVDEPNVSFRFSGKEDMINPLVMAYLVKKKLAPTKEELTTAIDILKAAQAGEVPPPQGQGGTPGAPPPPAGGPPAPPTPGQENPPGGNPAHPDWQMASKVASRSREMGGA